MKYLFESKKALDMYYELIKELGVDAEPNEQNDCVYITEKFMSECFEDQDEFEEKEQQVIAGIHRAVQPDFVEMESDLALIAVVGRGMKSTRGTAGRIFSALAHANVNVKMIDQGSSELNIIIGVENRDFETAVKAIYDIFVITQI